MKRAGLLQVADNNRGCAPNPAMLFRWPGVELTRQRGLGGGFPRSMSSGDMAHEIAIRQERTAILLSHFLREGAAACAVAHCGESGTRRQAGLRR